MDLLSDLGKFIRIHHVSEAPRSSYLLYDIRGGIYYVKKEKFFDFANDYLNCINYKSECSITLDLCHAVTHHLVLDIDIKETCSDQKIFNQYIVEFLIPAIKRTFDKLSHYTILFARRPKGNGLHIHFPEITIYHDDYFLFCTRLQPQLNTVIHNISFQLDIPQNWMLPHSAKPECLPYQPVRIAYYEQNFTCHIDLTLPERFELSRQKLKFKKKKSNTNSAFRLVCDFPYNAVLRQAFKFMMPVAIWKDILFTHVSYETHVRNEVQLDQFDVVAHYETHQIYQIFKGKHMCIQTSPEVSVYQHLEQHACSIIHFESDSPVLKRWWQFLCQEQKQYNDLVFPNIQHLLRLQITSLKNEESPLRIIMEYDKARYFMPVFYAVFRMEKRPLKEVIEDFRKLLTETLCKDLLRRLSEFDSDVIFAASQQFTKQTLLYCASHLHEKLEDFSAIFPIIIRQMENHLKSCLDYDMFRDVLVEIIDRYFPFITKKKSIRGGNTAKLVWNFYANQWMEFNWDDFKNLIYTINQAIQTFVESYARYPLKDNKFAAAFAYISIRNAFKDEEVIMNKSKWFLRTPQGVLDLLTNHVGAIVPEYFIQNKSINIRFDNRHTFNQVLRDARLIALHRQLFDRKFFDSYYELLQEENSGYYATLRSLIKESVCPLGEQMLRFYIHLCKFLRFDFTEMSFFMIALSSCLVATNYGKYIFILQGEKNNGKSKLFELMREVFGTYAQPVNSNVFFKSERRDTVPDLARSIFDCRVVTVEELSGAISENFMKLLTGNSAVTVRALYENGRHGIPTAKMWASTNNTPSCVATSAFCERVVPFHFEAKFVAQPPVSTREQISNKTFRAKPDDTFVTNCIKGMFLHMMYMWQDNANREDGYLHYPPIPESILIFKNVYLAITDIYVQFKSYADVQMIPGSSTTESDLQSAVRQFLNHVKQNTSIREEDVIERFDKEFADQREEMEDFQFDDDEPPEKKTKIIVYKNLDIKNLKR